MSVPEQLIAALIRRIRAFEQGDLGAVLDPRALVEADELLQYTRGDGGLPLDVLRVVAWLRWFRYQALPEGEDQDDLRAALALFTLVAAVDAQTVPEPVRRYLAAGGGNAGPGRQARSAVDLVRQSMRTGDPVALNQAIELLIAAVDAAPADHPNRAAMLSNLGAALRSRFERTGAGVDLDEAVRVGREAVEAGPADHSDRAMYLSNLGATLRIRFERTGAGVDLDEAVRVGGEAVEAAPRRPPPGICPTSASRCGSGSSAPGPARTWTRPCGLVGRR